MSTLDRISALEAKALEAKKKLDEIKAQKRALEAKVRSREAAKKRQQDTRRKILIGAAILAKVERGEWPRDRLLSLLRGTLTRDDDRALFDLPPLEQAGGSENIPSAAPPSGPSS